MKFVVGLTGGIGSGKSAAADEFARLAAAHDVIDNAGTLEQLRQQVAALHARYVKMAAPAKS